jgi:hypothetical protein
MSNTAPDPIAQLPRQQRRALDRAARLDEFWFEQRRNQCRVARLRAAIRGDDKALVVLSGLPTPRPPEQRVLVVVVRLPGRARMRKPVLWAGTPPPLDRVDVAIALATLEPGAVSRAGLEAICASWPRAVQ